MSTVAIQQASPAGTQPDQAAASLGTMARMKKSSPASSRSKVKASMVLIMG